jgi:hypothetical protein
MSPPFPSNPKTILLSEPFYYKGEVMSRNRSGRGLKPAMPFEITKLTGFDSCSGGPGSSSPRGVTVFVIPPSGNPLKLAGFCLAPPNSCVLSSSRIPPFFTLSFRHEVHFVTPGRIL